MTTAAPTLEALRHAQQLAFTAGSEELEVGDPAGLPLTLDTLARLGAGSPEVLQHLDAGLTANVFRLRDPAGREWTLKRARPQALVRNVDGQTSFLNEVQRRADVERLKHEPGGEARWRAIVDTRYASFRRGIILSPWIAGEVVHEWDERRLEQVFETICALWVEGLFEWDLSPGNILDDGTQLRLFDFGYMYRFDPLRHFNTAGHGADEPVFHPAERFETRNHCAWLLQLERSGGMAPALAAFRREKEIALEAYRRMRARIAARGAEATVLHWLDGITTRWSDALRGDGAALYLAENWRSHVLDLDDDLRGQTCTPMTLQRADWILAALRDHHDALQQHDAFLWGDRGQGQAVLLERYAAQRRQAQKFQVRSGGAEPRG